MGLKTWIELYNESKKRLKKNKDYEIGNIGDTTLGSFAGFIACLALMTIAVGLNSVVGSVFFGILTIVFLMAHFRGRDSIYAVEKGWK